MPAHPSIRRYSQPARSAAWALARATRLVLVLVMVLGCGLAAAQNIESVLAPGKLIKGHAKVEDDCKSCHVKFDRQAQDGRCTECHKEIGADLRDKHGWHGRLKPQACRECHTDHKGRDARIVDLDEKTFDHGQTDFLLKGKHQPVACKSCHVAGKRWAEAPQDCVSCHRKDDVHKTKLGSKCAECHNESDWKKAQFDHSKTRFALSGKHADVKCTDCHKTPDYKDTPRTCVGCHKKDDDSAKGHKGLYGDKCESCHVAKAWKPSTFNHDTDTKYKLTGKHRDAACKDCHSGNLFKVKPKEECVACHKKDDDGLKGHKGQYGEKCETCHVTKGWKPTTFNHDTDTKYKLTGKHRDAACKDCHTGHLYKVKLKDECYACHRKDDESETKGRKGHKGLYGEKCETCHVTKGWKPSTFNHDTDTKYTLLGKHKDAACATCHTGHLYKVKLTTDCWSCHKKDDKHKDTLGRDCASCHTERNWKDDSRKFDHDRTSFPLLGKHVTTECKSCHKSLMYKEAPKDCIGCHLKDDKHEGNLGKACADCHNEREWKDTRARFDHDRTKFQLRNGHVRTAKGVQVECKSCHANLKSYRKTPTDCYSCHKKDDKHEGQSGKTCDNCHADASWKVTRFDHGRTRFALAGRHVTVECKDCHTGMPRSLRFRDAQRDCYSCHKKDDKHKLKLGVACESCHNVRSWKSWDFDHNRRSDYKIDGAHLALACDACHTQVAPKGKPIAALSSNCIGCHRADDVHDGSFGMRCEQCHVTERWKRIVNRGLSMNPAPGGSAAVGSPLVGPVPGDACALGWSSLAGRACRVSVTVRT
ncbi:MAG: hypothetical protein RIQ60_3132 [Pseudomonadota bacterium]|jgi:hypothetical protein